MKKLIRITESDIGRLVRNVISEAKPKRPNVMNEPLIMIDFINKGGYDSDILFRMQHRDGERRIYKWINHREFDDYWKQQVCNVIFERFLALRHKKRDTDVVCKCIKRGDFDEDIANRDYSWFNQQTNLFAGIIKKAIEERLAIGKRYGLFKGLPFNIGYGALTNYEYDDEYHYNLLKGYKPKINKL